MAKAAALIQLVEQNGPDKLTRTEVVEHAREVRAYLEKVARRVEGVQFDAVSADVPCSVDYDDDLDGPYGLAELLNPTITVNFNRVREGRATRNGTTDEALNAARFALASTAFALGVFFGRILQGASEREIDSMERGLVHSILSGPHGQRDEKE